MPAIMTDRRRACERYPLQFPTVYSWRDGEGKRHVAEGVTRDVANNSAYINAMTCPPMSAQVLIEIRVLDSKTLVRRLSLNAKGEVCRTNITDTTSGFAVRIGRGFRVCKSSDSCDASQVVSRF